MMARVEFVSSIIPSRWAMTKEQRAQEEDGAEDQVETVKCKDYSSTYLIQQRQWSM